MMRFSTSHTLVAPIAILMVSAEHHISKRNHAAIDVSKREETELSVFRRSAGADFTFYQVCYYVPIIVDGY
jgi:hypothetical protein